MKQKTVDALKGSIKKWALIATGEGVDYGVRNCPLCRLSTGCNGCPVMQDTGKAACFDTPYYNYCTHVRNTHGILVLPYHIQCPYCVNLAWAEHDYLVSLLPMEELENEREILDEGNPNCEGLYKGQ